MRPKWVKLRGEICSDVKLWTEVLEMRDWQLKLNFRVHDPEDSGYADVDTGDIHHLHSTITFYLAPFEETGNDREHRQYLVLHELVHLLSPKSTEAQTAKIARTIQRLWKEAQ